MPKETLYNKKNKDELLKDLQKENFNRITLSFYKYTQLNNLDKLRDALYKEWNSMNILGRVYIAKEGINAQISLPKNKLDRLRIHVDSIKGLKDTLFKIAVEEGSSFIKLVIKVKNEIVAYNIPETEYDMTKIGKHLNYKDLPTTI